MDQPLDIFQYSSKKEIMPAGLINHQKHKIKVVHPENRVHHERW